MAQAASKPMTKTQLVATLADEMGSDKKTAAAALDALSAAVMEWGRPVTFSWPMVWAFVYTVLAPGIGATWLWFQLVNRIGAVRAATFHFLSPLFGVAIAAALLGERFGLSDVLGAIIVAAGILMVQLARIPDPKP